MPGLYGARILQSTNRPLEEITVHIIFHGSKAACDHSPVQVNCPMRQDLLSRRT